MATALHAADPGCEGMFRGVYPLGGHSEVPGVTRIQTERLERLRPYIQERSVPSLLREPEHFGLVAVLDEAVSGFAVYERERNFFTIIAIAVDDAAKGSGIDQDLIEKVIAEATAIRLMKEVRVLVKADDESLLDMFKQAGFEETEIIPGKFENRTKSGRLLKYTLKREEDMAPKLQLAPQPMARPKTRTAVIELPATKEFLHRIDPTLQNAD